MASIKSRFDLFAAKPNPGQVGQQIAIISNHFVVSYDFDKSIYSYYININQIENHSHHNYGRNSSSSSSNNNSNNKTFKNEQLYRSVMKRLIEKNCQPGNIFYNIHCIYDGASCMYTTERLPIIEDKMAKFRVELSNNDINVNEFEVCIKLVKLVSYQSIKDFYQNPVNDAHIEAIRSINLVVRHLFMITRFVVGRSSFHLSWDKDDRSNISSLKEISFGIFSSVQGCLSGLQLILDRSCTPFMKSLPLDESIRIFLRECGGNQRWNETNKKKIENIIKDYYFEVTNLQRSRRYKINGLTLESASRVMFTSNNQTISVAEYFSKTYSPLRYPDLPCVKVKKSRNDFIYFPVEVCKIVPDQKTKKLTTKEKADLIRNAASVNPSERFEVIQSSASELIENDQKQNYLREFGINIATQPVVVKARVLEVPKLLEGDNKEIKPTNGKWRINKFFRAIILKKWILIMMARFDDSQIDRFLDSFIRNGDQLGMKIKPPIKIHYNFDIKTIANFFQKLKQSYSDLELMFFLGCDSEIQYNAIKKCGDIDFSVPTQCMRQSNVFRFNQSIAVNVLQKINTKLGGINIALDCNRMPLFLKDNCNNTLVVGVDVAHPSPIEKNCPSVAALVGNSDGTFTQYTSSVKIQRYFRQEIIQELDQMLLEVIKAYETNTGNLPDRIIFYRDGVSEGQFRVVYDEEVHLIKESLAKLRPGYNAKLTFIIVQKRHHTRFVPDNSKDGIGKNYNVPPGTVVDNYVVHPRHFDFYLCSHAGIQGTSRPSHYCVLIDENSLTADQIQDLTNVLCHLYSRCSRSISIPTPVFYAHLAAFRARAHTQASTYLFNNNVDNDNLKMKMDYFSTNSFSNNNNTNTNSSHQGVSGGTTPSNRIHYTKHRVPCLDNLDNYIEMTPKMRSSMYFC